MATVSDLLHSTSMELEPRWSPHPDASIRWVAVSELTDPTPFLEGGEVLLITGIGREDWGVKHWDRYVQRLRQAEVCALGVALGLHFQQIPAALLAACQEHRLNLFAVPRKTPFVTITRQVAALLEAEELRGQRQLEAAQRRLIQAAASGREQALVEVLAAGIGGQIQILSAAQNPGSDAGAGEPGAGEAGEGGSGQQIWWIEPISAGWQIHAYLHINPNGPVLAWQRSLVSIGVALLTLLASTRVERKSAIRAAQARAVELLKDGDIRSAQILLETAFPGRIKLRGMVRTAVIGSGSAMSAPADGVLGAGTSSKLLLEAALSAIEDLPATVSAPPAGRIENHQLYLVFPALIEPGILGCLAPLHLGIGIGSQVALSQVRESFQAAEVAQSRAVERLGATPANPRQAAQPGLPAGNKSVVVYWDQILASGLNGALDAQAASAFAQSFLGKLRWEGGEPDLVTVLGAFIDLNGSRGAVAQRLNVHRNTVTARLEQIEKALGQSVDDPATRAEAWVALGFRAREIT